MTKNKPKLIRITTVPISLKMFLKNQLKYMDQYFDVIALSSSGKELEEIEKFQGLQVKDIEMSREITPVLDMISLWKMTLYFLKEKPDIVHTCTPKAGLIGMMAGLLAGVPHRMHTVAGMPLMESSGLKRKILIFVERLTYKCATNVYSNSIELKNFIVNKNLISKDKIKVLGNGSSDGIDAKYFKLTYEIKEEAKHLKSKYEISNDDFVFIFVGRIVRDKGINELLSAFDKLAKQKRNIKLLLVGSHEEALDPISNKSKEILKNNRHIIEVGFQNDVRPFFAMSDCLVFPSYREGFPNVVMQAGAMELPLIVSDINGCNEIVQDGVNGLIIPSKSEDILYNTMEKVLSDNRLRAELVKNVRKTIVDRYEQKFVWNAIKNEYDILLGSKND